MYTCVNFSILFQHFSILFPFSEEERGANIVAKGLDEAKKPSTSFSLDLPLFVCALSLSLYSHVRLSA